MIVIRLLSLTLFIWLSLLFSSCTDVIEPSKSEPIDSVIFDIAEEVGRVLQHTGTAFLFNEIIKLDTTSYEQIYSADFLDKISFNETKQCWLDSINRPVPMWNCDNDWDAYNGTIRINFMDASPSSEGEYIQLYFFPDTGSSLVPLSAPPVLRRIKNISDAYIKYEGAYVGTPVRYDIEHFYCYRFLTTLYPLFTHSDSLDFIEVSDSSAPLGAGAVGSKLQGQLWDYWKKDSAKVIMGFLAKDPVDVPVRFMRWGKYESTLTGYKAINLIDSLVFTSDRLAIDRAGDSSKVIINDNLDSYAKIKLQGDNSFICNWSSGTNQAFGTEIGFRSSQKKYSDSTTITNVVEAGYLKSKLKSGTVSDSLSMSISQDTLEWNTLIDSTSFSGRLYWSLRQVCSKFELQDAGISGWATFNPWNGTGKCYVKNQQGLIYIFTLTTNSAAGEVKLLK